MKRALLDLVLPSLAAWAIVAGLISGGYAWGRYSRSRQLEGLMTRCVRTLEASTQDTAECLQALEGAQSVLEGVRNHDLAMVNH